MPYVLHARSLTVRAGVRTLVSALELAVAPGEFIAVLGRNGCGKSLTLHTLAGLRAADGGEVELAGQDLTRTPRRRVAQLLGLLPQDREEALPSTAFEAALLGRHPHQSPWRGTSGADRELATASLERLGVGAHAARPLTTLSGGEQRRAAMAALLTQQPRLYLLDEPTNHLDPHHQIEVLNLFRGLCDQDAAVIATLHDPALAERYADRVLLLHGDGRWQLGPVAQLLNAVELSALYRTPISELGTPGWRAFIPS